VPYVDSERLLLVHIDDVAKALVSLLRTGHVTHTVYNAPCESAVVGDLKREIERLNSRIHVGVGDACATCNPRLVDWSRFEEEFSVSVPPIFERLGRAAG